MKKTLVDLTYFSFSDETPQDIIRKCESTIGFIEKLNSNFTTHFVVRSENQLPEIEHQSIKIHFFKGNFLKKWQIPFQFNHYVKSLKPDYVLVHGFGSAHYLIFLKLICPNAKILLQCNGFASEPKGFKKLVYKISDRFIDGYLFTGIGNAKHWHQNNIFSKSKIIEVMEGSTHFSFQGNENRKESSFIWVGRLDENKDPLTILKAFHQFSGSNPAAKLTMVFHEGNLQSDVTNYVTTHNLASKIDLKGFVAHDLLEKLYHEHQYFILGSHYEGSGYALLESMACGCVPIVTKIPSFEFMTDNGNCGFLFSPKNQEELLAQLSKTRNIDYEEYQKNVLQNFDKKLSSQAIANSIASTFQSL